MSQVNRLLMVALDFPPCKSAGVQRTQKFVEFLPEYGWSPIVLTGMPLIYDELSAVALPDSLSVYRAFGLNTFKHLSYKGKHFQFMTKPDRYSSWYWHGVVKGMQAIREMKPRIIWSTFPCSTAHKIATTLHRRSGLPWVADFRDPFAGTNPLVKADNAPGAAIDRAVVENADILVFSTQNTLDVYREAYPDVDHRKFHVITNGFNEEEFVAAEKRTKDKQPESGFSILHSGALYPRGRDPLALLKAVRNLRDQNRVPPGFRIVFRGCTPPPEISDFVQRHQLSDCVLFKPSISYMESIDEMLTTQALFLLQGEMFNNQIPGKAYEYLRSGKPILALTDHKGATAELLRTHDAVFVADMCSEAEIAEQLLKLFDAAGKPVQRQIEQYSRNATARQLAGLLDTLV